MTLSSDRQLAVGLAYSGVITSSEGLQYDRCCCHEGPEQRPSLDVASGAFIVMIGASIVLSGLLLMTAPIISDLYYQKDAAGKVVLRTLSNGM